MLFIYHLYIFYNFFVCLNRIIDRDSQKLDVQRPIGRPRLLTLKSVEQLRQEAIAKDLSQQSFTPISFNSRVEEVRIDERKAKGLNSLIQLKKPSRSTDRRYRKLIVPETCHSAGSKNANRVRALLEVYNAVNAAALVAVLSDCPSETFISADGVGVTLGNPMGMKQKVLMAKGSKKALAQRNQSAATHDSVSQCRTAHLLVAHSAIGQYICAIQIKDEKIASVSVHTISDTISVWLLPTDYDHTEFFSRFLKEFVIPMLNKARALTNRIRSQYSAGVAQAPVADPQNDDYRSVRAILSFDGESSQISAATSDEFIRFCNEERIELVKWAAMASLVQQPADVGKMHTRLHTYFEKAHGKASKLVPNPSLAMQMFINKDFKETSISAAVKDTYTKFLQHVESAVSDSFTKSSIDDAWQTAGYKPYDARQILSGYAGWNLMKDADAQKLLKYTAIFDSK